MVTQRPEVAPLWRRIAARVAPVAALALLFAPYVVERRRAHEAARALPASERAALYQQAMGALQNECASAPSPPLDAYCQAQARLVSSLPECGPDCQDLAGRFGPVPSR